MSSGIGIGGAGSDDYNIHTERDTASMYQASKKLTAFGAHGQRWDEECGQCGRATAVCNDCDCCERHCDCYRSTP